MLFLNARSHGFSFRVHVKFQVGRGQIMKAWQHFGIFDDIKNDAFSFAVTPPFKSTAPKHAHGHARTSARTVKAVREAAWGALSWGDIDGPCRERSSATAEARLLNGGSAGPDPPSLPSR